MTKAKGTERDISVRDSRWWCRRCGRRHAPGSICPPTRMWLVATFCPNCWVDGFQFFYCKWHWTKGGNTQSGVVEIERHRRESPGGYRAARMADGKAPRA